jgi:hypothetical protein
MLPGFSASSSLYLTRNHYRATYAPGYSAAALAARTGVLVLSQSCVCDDCPETCNECLGSSGVEESCCPPCQAICDDDGEFHGCCPDTLCKNADGSDYCCGDGTDLLCCGDGNCVSTTDEIDPCTACSNACTETQTCCTGATKVGPNFNEHGNAPYCTDTSVDDSNCGGCGVVCRGGQVCVDGHCVGIKLKGPVTPVRNPPVIPVHPI